MRGFTEHIKPYVYRISESSRETYRLDAMNYINKNEGTRTRKVVNSK